MTTGSEYICHILKGPVVNVGGVSVTAIHSPQFVNSSWEAVRSYSLTASLFV